MFQLSLKFCFLGGEKVRMVWFGCILKTQPELLFQLCGLLRKLENFMHLQVLVASAGFLGSHLIIILSWIQPFQYSLVMS